MELGVCYLPNCMLRIHFNLVWEGLFMVPVLYMMKWKLREVNVSGRALILLARPYELDSRTRGRLTLCGCL